MAKVGYIYLVMEITHVASYVQLLTFILNIYTYSLWDSLYLI